MVEIMLTRLFRFVFVFVFVFITIASSQVRADVFLYTDPEFKFTFSVPDSWKRQIASSPNTRIKFVAPVVGEYAYCEVAAEKDRRFQIYPKRLMGAAMRENFSVDFWLKEVARRFDNSAIKLINTDAGLDKGDATMAEATYDMQLDKDKNPVRMRAVLLTSVYGDVRYTMICGASDNSYFKWKNLFGSIISSMTLDDRYVIKPNGLYRNFLLDRKKIIPHPGIGDIVR